MEIKKHEYHISVCKVEDYSKVNLEDAFVFLGRTDDERSLVCRTENAPDNVTERDDGWRMMRIQGGLDFFTHRHFGGFHLQHGLHPCEVGKLRKRPERAGRRGI